MTRASHYAINLGIWGAMTYGVLQLQNIPLDDDEALCGVWGCLPPLGALIAYHGFCLMLAVPPVWLLFQKCTPSKLAFAGKGFTLLAILGMVAISTHEALTWLGAVPAEYRQFFLRRVLFVIATNPEIPVIPLLLAGATCWSGSRLKRRRIWKREPSTVACGP